jgi:hypothetical protein
MQKALETLGRAPGNNDRVSSRPTSQIVSDFNLDFNESLVNFSEEERAHLRDPENCKRFRREIESEMQVCLPKFLL